MNEIEKKDVETYIRNLISKDFGSKGLKTDKTRQCNRHQGKRTPSATSPTLRPHAIQKDKNNTKET